VPTSAEGIAASVAKYYADDAALQSISTAGQEKAKRLFDTDLQIGRRLQVFGREMNLD